MSGRLEGKVALITGGANGIGLACALRFADEGAAIVVADVLDDAGSKAVAAVAEHGVEGLYLHLDASRAEDNQKVVAATVERFGRLDILVTAAGILHATQRSGDIGNDTEYVRTHTAKLGRPGAALAALTIDEWRRVIEVNLTGTMLAVQATAASMIQTRRSGSIITISSIGGKHPGAGSFAYSVSKAGVWMFTKSAARDLASAGIRVNAIGPGFIQTNMTAAVFELEAVRSAVLAQVPMGRLGRPQDIANAALFLASDESSYMTGEILHPDGGFYTE